MNFLSLLFIFISISSALLALGLAVFVLTRNRRAQANRWLAIGLATAGFYQGFMLVSNLTGPGQWRLGFFKLALAAAAAIPPGWLAFSLTFGESNGGSHLARWRPALFGLTAAMPLAWIGLMMGHIVQPAHLGTTGVIVLALDVWGKVYFAVYLVGLALALLHLENLYRYAERLTRRKIKYLVVGVFLAFTFQIVAVSYALLYRVIHPLHPFLTALAFLLGQGLIAFAIVRHHLLDVNIFISRYVVYRSLTLALVGGYLVSLGLAAEVFRWFDVPFDLLSGTFLAILGAVALSLLLLSEDFRRRLQRFIHTHFYRDKYDYRLEWMEYTRRLSRAAAVPEIAAQTVTRILEVMWVRQAAMYAAGDSSSQMTLTYQANYERLPLNLELSQMAVQALQEQAKHNPSTAGQRDSSDGTIGLARDLFGEIPIACLVPIAVLDTLVGLLIVGPEVSGKPFGVDDRDLLAAVAAQAGALMVNARLAQEVSEGHELQVLARLSAFVAHDLKNAVSMLAMLAENATLHMNKPEFQADAIRTLGEVTAKMRKLLATLASPNGCTRAQSQPISLATRVEAWMQEMHGQVPPRIRLETHLGWTPDVRMDPEQFRSVLHNLVLNSVEAIPKEGTILVETFQENGQAVLAVTDTGSGMTREFMQLTLFRPFQTTKPRGLGIGLYQCRHIVQALGGTLSAESQEGKGTRMVVRLPTQEVSVQRSEVSTTTR